MDVDGFHRSLGDGFRCQLDKTLFLRYKTDSKTKEKEVLSKEDKTGQKQEGKNNYG